ncbi:MAG: hypothetical protein Q8O12_03885 [Candidatus Omnitrophota bacterium]|nr:hypothetical protein [Candidatus Omnitrophota bacterium]
MKKICGIFLIMFLVFSLNEKAYAGGDARARYEKAVRCILLKQDDFALIEFRSVIREFPKSGYAGKSVFAIAEYCYDHGIYNDAIKNFTEYINNYPASKAVTFAKAHLLKIIEDIKEPTWEEKRIFEDIKKDFFSKPLFLVFSEYKKTSYKSDGQNIFKIKYHTDNIEVYRNNQPFLKINQ